MARKKYPAKPNTVALSNRETLDFLSNVNIVAHDLLSNPKAARWSDLPVNTNSERLRNFQQEWATFQDHVLNKRIAIQVSSTGFSLDQNALSVPHQFQNYDPDKNTRYAVNLFRDMSGLIMTSNRMVAVKLAKNPPMENIQDMTTPIQMTSSDETTPSKNDKIARIFNIRA